MHLSLFAWGQGADQDGIKKSWDDERIDMVGNPKIRGTGAQPIGQHQSHYATYHKHKRQGMHICLQLTWLVTLDPVSHLYPIPINIFIVLASSRYTRVA